MPTREGQVFAYRPTHNIVLWQSFHKLIHKFTQSVLRSTVFLIITPYFCWRLLLSLQLTNKGNTKRTTPFQWFRKLAPASFFFLLAAQVLLKINVSVEPCLVSVVLLMRWVWGWEGKKSQYTHYKKLDYTTGSERHEVLLISKKLLNIKVFRLFCNIMKVIMKKILTW